MIAKGRGIVLAGDQNPVAVLIPRLVGEKSGTLLQLDTVGILAFVIRKVLAVMKGGMPSRTYGARKGDALTGYGVSGGMHS
jgi:hypothetical protein